MITRHEIEEIDRAARAQLEVISLPPVSAYELWCDEISRPIPVEVDPTDPDDYLYGGEVPDPAEVATRVARVKRVA